MDIKYEFTKLSIDMPNNIKIHYHIRDNLNVCIDSIYGNVTDFTIPDKILNKKVDAIGTHCFENMINLKNIVVPDTVDTLYPFAFADNKSLRSVKLSDNITQIPFSAFSNCSLLSNVIISNNVTDICMHAFSDCKSFERFDCPLNLTTIDAFAFSGTGIHNFLLEKNVANINPLAFYKSSCEAIEVVPDNKTLYSDEGVVFNNDGSLLIYPCCKKDLLYTVPKNTTHICSLAFNNVINLQKIICGKNVSKIEDQAFDSCPNLKSIILMNSNLEISPVVFFNIPLGLTIKSHANSRTEQTAKDNLFSSKNINSKLADFLFSNENLPKSNDDLDIDR